NRKLVREDKLAISAGVSYDSTARGPGMIYLYGSPSEGRTVAELEAALRAEIARIQQEGVSEAELKRTKAQLVASQVYKLDSVFGQAMEIGQMEAIGLSWKEVDIMIDRLQQVTAADVQAAANKYFDDDALTIGILDPQPLDGLPRRQRVPTRH
ncbi:MAG: insulinase family protein, partial [Dechloromonas sp.]|nr:insulinase family protein [Dechloromonas sp.]